jgi:predicted nucleic acid-binding Zn ribbon protein
MATKDIKTCTFCGDPLRGRYDKRFCSDQCRSAFHNRQNSSQTNFMRNINNILRKNRRILAALNPDGKTNVHRDKLVEQGFNFRYFTNEYVTRSGNVYRFIYEQGYLERDNDYFTLVVRQEYVE